MKREEKKLRAVITGGGTGGHIYPALAIAKGLKNRYNDAELLYIGTKEGLEAEIIPREGLKFNTVSASGLERKVSLKNIKTLLRFSKGIMEAQKILRSFKPCVVIGTGGYVCAPVMLAAVVQGIPTVIHEQNAYPGLTNRLLSPFVSRVCVTFEESIPYFKKKGKIAVTGLPVRPEIYKTTREQGAEYFGLDPDKFTILIVGGSRGARSLNKAAVPLIQWVVEEGCRQAVMVTGKNCYDEVLKDLLGFGIDASRFSNIKVVPYLHQMEYGLAAADLVISRAGASFLAELTVRGLPAVLVPYPFASGNHQEFNARALEKKGAVKVVLDKYLKGRVLLDEVQRLLKEGRLGEMSENSRQAGRPHALDEIIDVVSGVLKKA
ncbi:MAG: undecaprenyldiphospho-muramoylpentapeptide beta-N-acetylglucosaminyltransferase [Clostridia bacterium]|nr:undecaprenyldiphospho-muramoylpentapeptide beta-N-acetylglucosaminyltransferase [Clostridia bacterium]